MTEQNDKPQKPIKRYIILIAGTLAGVIAGYLYFYFIGCRSGACPLRANPYYNMLLGGLLGYIVTDWILSALRKRHSKNEKPNREK